MELPEPELVFLEPKVEKVANRKRTERFSYNVMHEIGNQDIFCKKFQRTTPDPVKRAKLPETSVNEVPETPDSDEGSSEVFDEEDISRLRRT